MLGVSQVDDRVSEIPWLGNVMRLFKASLAQYHRWIRERFDGVPVQGCLVETIKPVTAFWEDVSLVVRLGFALMLHYTHPTVEIRR